MRIIIGKTALSAQTVAAFARSNAKLSIDEKALERVKASRQTVEEIVKKDKVVYGITTGFGKFADVKISEKDCAALQKNLILSHACGVGEPLPPEVVRGMILLRVASLSVGHSGIRPEVLQLMCGMVNSGITPVIPKKGSLGASGDLAPLAHMALPLLGLGEVFYKGKRMPSAEAFNKAGLTPLELTAKEGLALINGTQAMNAHASLAICDCKNLSAAADITAALTVEALRGITDAFDERVHNIRRQTGQINTAENLRRLLTGSERVTRQGEKRVQDAYTLRCIPQIHGPTKDALNYVAGIIDKEINAVTDNPLIFAGEAAADCISGGNFHGQCLSMALDFLGIAASELANVSERRTERLVNPQLSGLPAFLTVEGGLNSGFMIPQYVAAALVSENKVFAHPACVDSITSSANQEDHVSMGMTAALKAREITKNVANVLGIELFAACQAVELAQRNEGKALKLAPATQAVFDLVRAEVPFIAKDDYLSPLIQRCEELISSGRVVEAAQGIVGKLK